MPYRIEGWLVCCPSAKMTPDERDRLFSAWAEAWAELKNGFIRDRAADHRSSPADDGVGGPVFLEGRIGSGAHDGLVGVQLIVQVSHSFERRTVHLARRVFHDGGSTQRQRPGVSEEVGQCDRFALQGFPLVWRLDNQF